MEEVLNALEADEDFDEPFADGSDENLTGVYTHYNYKLLTFLGESQLTTQSGTVCASAWQDRKVIMIMYTNMIPSASHQCPDDRQLAVERK